jgi:hypothetical protein
MATIIERDSNSTAGALLIFILFALLMAGGLWFAYTHDVFGHATVIENNKTVFVPTPTPATPPTAPANR